MRVLPSISAARTISAYSFSAIDGTGKGGALYSRGGSIALYDCNIEGCHSDVSGGAIAVENGISYIVSTNFRENSSDNGGAVYLEGGMASIENSLFSNNQAK
jgi:predicted outer membrane repeat protein